MLEKRTLKTFKTVGVLLRQLGELLSQLGEVYIKYKGTEHKLEAEKVYESDQVMRIKVYGKKDFMLLENDYPFLILKNSKKAIKWKLKNEGFIDIHAVEDCELVAEIIRKLEYMLKGKDKAISDRINHLRAKP